jgi:hypothetical protein
VDKGSVGRVTEASYLLRIFLSEMPLLKIKKAMGDRKCDRKCDRKKNGEQTGPTICGG